MDKQIRILLQSLNRVFTNQLFNDFTNTINSEPLDNRTLETTVVIKKFKELLVSDDARLIHTLPKDTELFRCRKFTKNNIEKTISCDCENNLHGFDPYGSKEPPITLSGEGRNNISGASYLYLSENEYTACAEICPNNLEILSVAKFKIKNDLRIFDLSVDDNFSQYDNSDEFISTTELISLIMSSFYHPVSDEKNYLVSQYFSDLIRKYGFDGVCYLSSKSMCKNYTIFACGDNNIEFVSNELIRNHITKHDLYRINDSTRIEPQISDIIKEITAEDIETIKGKLIKAIERNTYEQVENADSKQG